MLWLLKGKRDEPGWRDLQRDSKEEKIDIVIFDPLAWAMIESDEAPSGYEGLVVSEPADGLYVSATGVPVYMVGGCRVEEASEVIEALGEKAQELLKRIGDPDTVLERLGRMF